MWTRKRLFPFELFIDISDFSEAPHGADGPLWVGAGTAVSEKGGQPVCLQACRLAVARMVRNKEQRSTYAIHRTGAYVSGDIGATMLPSELCRAIGTFICVQVKLEAGAQMGPVNRPT
jgi:hypothetical protein